MVTLASAHFLGVIAGLAIGLTSALVLAKALSLNTIAPLKSMQDVVEKVEQGIKGEQAPITRKDEIGQLAAAINNLTERDKAVQQANTDPLTGLANRRHLLQRLSEILSQDTPVTLIFIDLDGFKPINDDHGHEAGDEALRQVAERLQTCARENDIVCRLGGDEFLVGFVGLKDREIIKQRGDKILEVINQPYWHQSTRMRMGASLGIAIAPEDAKTADELLNAADESMYAAKQGGKNAYRFYS